MGTCYLKQINMLCYVIWNDGAFSFLKIQQNPNLKKNKNINV